MKPKLSSLLTLSHKIADAAWFKVQFWSTFSQTIIGNSLMKSLDQMTVTLVQAMGIKKDREHYLLETKVQCLEAFVWLDKARRRKLIAKNEYQQFYTLLKTMEQGLES